MDIDHFIFDDLFHYLLIKLGHLSIVELESLLWFDDTASVRDGCVYASDIALFYFFHINLEVAYKSWWLNLWRVLVTQKTTGCFLHLHLTFMVYQVGGVDFLHWTYMFQFILLRLSWWSSHIWWLIIIVFILTRLVHGMHVTIVMIQIRTLAHLINRILMRGILGL